jgi:serine/threonine-protein kinase
MYHVMSGKMPFPGETPIDRLGRRIGGKPVPITEVVSDLPTGLVKVMDRLLAHKPDDRYQSAIEAAEALEALQRPRQTAQPSPRRTGSDIVPSPITEPMPPSVSDEWSLITVRPAYPVWFKPLAVLAEKNPLAALLSVLGALTIAFGIGFAVAQIVR